MNNSATAAESSKMRFVTSGAGMPARDYAVKSSVHRPAKSPYMIGASACAAAVHFAVTRSAKPPAPSSRPAVLLRAIPPVA